MSYEERIGDKTFYFSNVPRISVTQFFSEVDKLIMYDLTGIPYESVIQNIQKLCRDYTHLLSLQEYTTLHPGDIIYYSPGGMYHLGHMETVIGISNSSTFLNVYKSHPSETGYDELQMRVSKNEFSDKIFCLHYNGPNAPLIRATASFITKLFISQKKLDYGGFCSIIFNRCSEYSKSVNGKRIERLERALRKLVSSDRTTAVCSGFSILMFQLAFVIHGMIEDLNEAMPISAKHCSPWSAFSILHNNANWVTIQSNAISDENQYIIHHDARNLLQSSDIPMRPNLPSILTRARTIIKPRSLAITVAKPRTVARTVARTAAKPRTVARTAVKPRTVARTAVKPRTVARTAVKPRTVARTAVKPRTVARTAVKPRTVSKTLRTPRTLRNPGTPGKFTMKQRKTVY